jgi:hypothetical protein
MVIDPPAEELQRLPPELEAASIQQYNRDMRTASVIDPTLNDALSEDVPIPPGLTEAILTMGLSNAVEVTHYLAHHRSEISRFEGLSAGQIRRAVLDLSVKLAAGGPVADKLPYRAYQRLRERR